MGTIQPLRDGTEERKKLLSLNSKNVLITIRESPDSVMLFIGGPEFYCVNAQLFPPDSRYASLFGRADTGNLPHLYYNQLCSLEHNFVRGVDTSNILRLLISYIANNYPYVKYLTFSDASYRECDSGGKVELPEMAYITTGQTWYEKHFGAFLQPTDAARFREADIKFQALKPSLSWSDLQPYIHTNDIELRTLFESAKSWQEFFVSVRAKMGSSEFCSWLAPWLHQFMEAYFNYRFFGPSYYIPISPLITYTEKSYNKGSGKRYTRRNIKIRHSKDIRN